jgi:Alcohol dehydrogenase GroES-like domain
LLAPDTSIRNLAAAPPHPHIATPCPSADLRILPPSMETTALVLYGANQPFQVKSILIDWELKAQDVLVEIHATGICHTDIGVQKLGKFPAKYPRVLGHEGIYSRR